MTMAVIITNGIVLMCDVANRCGRYNILVHEGRILDLAERLETLTKDHPHATIIDARDKLIVPGFVNAHYHGASFLLRAATHVLHYSLWKNDPRLNQATSKFIHAASHDDVRRVYQAAYLAHVRSGTTCVGEFPPMLGDAGFEKMLEGIASSGVTPVVTLQNWDQIRKTQAMGAARPRSLVSLGEEEEFTVYSFEHLTKAAKELKAPLLAHIVETKEDVEILRQNFQRDGVSILHSFNALQPTTALVHANFATEDEARLIKSANGGVTVCARSTAVKQTGYPSLRHLAKHNVRLSLGTDWDNVDMLEEMRFMYQLPLIAPGLRQFSSVEMLRMATINGAQALGIANELGSIETNKRADLVFFDVADIRLPVVQTTAAADWSRLLVEHLGGADICDVMVNGEFKVRNREVTEVGERNVKDGFRELLKKYFASAEPAHAPAHVTTNVLPFTAERLPDEEQLESYETGFAPAAESAKIHDIAERDGEPHTLANLPKPKREPLKPELPKDTRRVFGDEEEF
jgi:5-methylthioadenosine/S-adenosylhomocysteine deaminase